MNASFRRTPATFLLILANIAVFLVCELLGGSENYDVMNRMGAVVTPTGFSPDLCLRLIAAMFLHFGFTHLFNNMVSLFVMGTFLEERIGRLRFLTVYLLGGTAGNVVS